MAVQTQAAALVAAGTAAGAAERARGHAASLADAAAHAAASAAALAKPVEVPLLEQAPRLSASHLRRGERSLRRDQRRCTLHARANRRRVAAEAARLDLLRAAEPAPQPTGAAVLPESWPWSSPRQPQKPQPLPTPPQAAHGSPLVAPVGPHALFAVAAFARTATLVAAGAVAARAAAVKLTGQAAQAAVHHPDPVGDRSQGILGVAAIGDRRREVRASRVDVDRRNLAGDRVEDDPGPNRRRGRGNRSDRDCRGQGQRRQSRYPSPYSETHGQSLFNVRCSLLECRNRRALVVTGRPAHGLRPTTRSRPPRNLRVSRNAGRRPWRITDRVGLVHSPFGSSAPQA